MRHGLLHVVRASLALAAAALLSGCGPSSEIDRLGEYGPLAGPFYVSSFFAPSGHMGDGQEPGHITADIGEGCLPRPAGAGGDCYRFTYTPGEMLWSGVYWVHPANNWGSRPGRRVADKYTRVSFYAATDFDSLGVQFISGGISDPKLEFKDQYRVSTFETIGRDYQKYTLDVSAETFDSVIGAFAWVTNYPAGTDWTTATPTVIYIDDLLWE